MSDPTPGGAGMPDPGLPTPEQPDPTPPQPNLPDAPPLGGDETVRVPAQPEVTWDAPEPPRAMPWEAPAAGAAGAAGASVPPPLPPAAAPAPAGTWGDPGTTQAPPAGVLSAATVGWVAPPPTPEPTGKPGWVVASTGVRVAAFIVDGLLAGILIGVVVGLVLAIAPGLSDGGVEVSIAYALAVTGFYFLYFVGFWTSEGKATPGMRIFKLQVANAVDGKRLAIGPAIVRWLSLGFIFSIIGVIPVAAGLAGIINFFWAILLLITTATNSMHQGLHDRWAASVVVRPADAGAGSGLMAACLIIVGIIFLFALFGIVGLIFLGSQVSKILSAVGSSI